MIDDARLSLGLVRRLFPALSDDKVYLDNAATTHKPLPVIDAMRAILMRDNASLYRGFYPESEALTERYEQIRASIASRIGATSAASVVLTRGATDGLNTIARSWLIPHLKPGDTIVITELDHHANSLPWYDAARRCGARVLTIPIDAYTLNLNLDTLTHLITQRTRFVSIPLSSNIRGPLTDGEIEPIVARTREVGAALCFDAAQVVGHAPLHIPRWNPDFVVWSGHKMFAPTGTGVLYVAPHLHDSLVPADFGGGMVRNAQEHQLIWEPMPRLLEAGTRSPEAVVGLGAAYDFLAEYGDFSLIRNHEQSLMYQLLDGIIKIPGVRILGSPEVLADSSSILTFASDTVHSHDLATYCAQHAIAVRAGQHCCQMVHDRIGVPHSLRISCALYTSAEDIERCVSVLTAACRLLK